MRVMSGTIYRKQQSWRATNIDETTLFSRKEIRNCLIILDTQFWKTII